MEADIVFTGRMASGDESIRRNGDGGSAPDLQGMLLCYRRLPMLPRRSDSARPIAVR